MILLRQSPWSVGVGRVGVAFTSVANFTIVVTATICPHRCRYKSGSGVPVDYHHNETPRVRLHDHMGGGGYAIGRPLTPDAAGSTRMLLSWNGF